MKTFYSILLVLLLTSCATIQMVTTPKQDGIIETRGTKDELYIKANQWMVKTFNNAKSVIQFQDKEAGKIMGKYLMNSITWGGGLYASNSSDVYSLITISVKDNATKIEIEPTNEWKYDKSGVTILNYSSEKAQDDIKKLIEDYKKFMTTSKETW